MADEKKEKKAKKTKVPDKTLCKLVKSDLLTKSPEAYRELVRAPGYLCRKCGRVAGNKKNLCKPEAL